MATISYVRTPTEGRTFSVVWETLTETNDDGQAISIPGASDISVQMFGSFGAGTVSLQGSNLLQPDVTNDAHWAAVHDGQGNAITLSAAGIESVAENMLWYRVHVNSGTAVDVDVHMLFRSTM